MAQVINTNIMSLNAQRNLNTSQAAQSQAIQRLSSGLRLNSAKDDAAGLAISERMSAQVRGLSQAVRNSQDAISLAQTAEGALGAVGNALQRIRELAVQSRNATNSADDRNALNAEAVQLRQEIDRISSQTAFNGVRLLDGSLNAAFQVGANAGELITVDLRSVNVGSATLGTRSVAQVTGAAATAFTVIAAGDLTINGVSVGLIADTTTPALRAAQIETAVNSVSAQTGVQATVNASHGVVLTNPSGGNIQIGLAGTATLATTGLTAGTFTPSSPGSVSVSGFTSLDISTVIGADTALRQMDAALTSVNTARATLGAVQNRFEAVVSSLQTTNENLTAARSRIQDADFAAETAALTRAQILQQAGVAMLAQANAVPQNVLALLRG